MDDTTLETMQNNVTALSGGVERLLDRANRAEAENKRLQEEIERLHSEFTRLRVIEAELVKPEPELPRTHVLFVPTPTRYLLLERQGPPPKAGTELSLSEGNFLVGKVGRAPVPGERRACAFLLSA